MILPAALRRVLAHRTVTAAASVTVLLAALTFSVLTATASAISDVGTRRALAEATSSDTALVFTATAASGAPGAGDREVAAAARAMMRPYPVRVQKALVTTPLVAHGHSGTTSVGLAAVDGYARHVRLLSGSTATQPGDVLIPDTLARQIGVGAGGVLTVDKPLWGGTGTEDHRVAGVYTVADDDPVFWGAVHQTLGSPGGPYAPVVFGSADMLAGRDHLAPVAQSVWYAVPDLHDATVSGVAGAVQRIIRAENGDVVAAVFHGAPATVNSLALLSRLGLVLADIEHAEVAGMSGFLIIATLLAVLAAFAVALTLRLLREHHADESRLVRARGAGGGRLIGTACGEALLVSVPALVVAPFATGPLARWLHGRPGLESLPAPHSPAAAGVLVSVLITAFCLLIQGLAALAESRGRPATGRTRSARMAAFQRAGVDGALAVLAVLGYLQMRHYKSPVTADTGIDPILVAAPAVTAAAAAALALRLLPFAAAAADRRIGAARGLSGALGGWQVSRRAARHAGTVLLLVLALAVGAMTVTGTAMRSRSAEDRALFRIGSDLKVSGSSLPPEVLRSLYTAQPGVEAATPLATSQADFGQVQATLVGVNAADVTAGRLRLRPDLTTHDLGRTMAPLVKGAKSWGVPLPGRPESLRFTVTLDDRTFAYSLVLTFRDADGTPLVRTVALPQRVDTPIPMDVPLLPAGNEGHGLAYPLTLDGLDITYAMAVQHRAPLKVDISALRTGPADTPLAISPQTAWHQHIGKLDVGDGQPFTGFDECVIPAGASASLWPGFCGARRLAADHLTFSIATGALYYQNADDVVTGTVGVRPGPDPEQAGSTPDVPVLATDALLTDRNRKVGDVLEARIGGVTESLRIVGRVAGFPGLAPGEKALIVDRGTLGEFLNLAASEPIWRTGWLLTAADGSGGTAAAAIRASAEFGAVTSRAEIADQLREGAFSGSQSALLLIAAATAPFFAMVGFAVAAVAALRDRRREFAVLRAMGARPRQLAAALWVEQVVLALLAVAIGLLIGIGTALLTVPLVTVDDGGSAVFPEVLPVLPWLRDALVALGTAGAVVLVVMGAARTLGRVDLARMLRAGEDG